MSHERGQEYSYKDKQANLSWLLQRFISFDIQEESGMEETSTVMETKIRDIIRHRLGIGRSVDTGLALAGQ